MFIALHLFIKNLSRINCRSLGKRERLHFAVVSVKLKLLSMVPIVELRSLLRLVSSGTPIKLMDLHLGTRSLLVYLQIRLSRQEDHFLPVEIQTFLSFDQV
jgi:hypothetical protein